MTTGTMPAPQTQSMSGVLPLVIAGATASGKSALALRLAEVLHGEIVCADSRQIYGRLAIAAAGPTDEERARVPHHLYGTADPKDTVTAGAWAARCDEAVREIGARGRLPIVVGGTGLYLRAWRVGLEAPTDPVVRARLDDEAGRVGSAALHARLTQVDPEAAAAISPGDRLRVVRALEIFEVKGGPRGATDLSRLPARVDACWILVDAPLSELEPSIRVRAEAMFAGGIVDEAVALERHLGPGHRLLETLGVAEALALARGALSVTDAVTRTALRTRQYARRQRTWFKKEPWWQLLPRPSAGRLESAVDEVQSRLASSRNPR